MEKIEVEKQDHSVNIFLNGELTVESAILLKRELQTIVDSAEKAKIEFAEDAEAHAAVIQLILALKMEFEQNGKNVTIAIPEKAPLKKSIETLGVASFL